MLNSTRFGSGAEPAHQEPFRTALCQRIPLQAGPWLLLRLPCMRQSRQCSPRRRESPAAANSKIPAAGCTQAGASLPPSLPRGPILHAWEDLEITSLDVRAIVTSAHGPAKCQRGFRMARSFLVHRNLLLNKQGTSGGEEENQTHSICHTQTIITIVQVLGLDTIPESEKGLDWEGH